MKRYGHDPGDSGRIGATHGRIRRRHVIVVTAMALGTIMLMFPWVAAGASAKEPLVIAASPSLSAPVEALAQAFEARRPDVTVFVYYDSGLDLRRTIAAMENHPRGQYFIGTGPIHLVAPGGDELITRLQQKYYVLPGTKRTYASERLVVVVPESLVDAPASLEALAQDARTRVAVADPVLTIPGRKTHELFSALGLTEALQGRLDVAADARGVLDHLLSGQADVGIISGPDAIEESQRVRVAFAAPDIGYTPVVHSMAMERYCPNRRLCEEFLQFIATAEAQAVLKRVGYAPPGTPAR
jgi:molybdate transport system substrate-binding protein